MVSSARPYTTPEWKAKRMEIIRRDGCRCVNCQRSAESGAKLQVHHLRYLADQPVWASPAADLVTLCRLCHARVHGKLMPQFGWVCTGYEDLGGLCGECSKCETAIRHVYYVEHPVWPPLAVGEECCDHLIEPEDLTVDLDWDEPSPRGSYGKRLRAFLAKPEWRPASGKVVLRPNGVRIEVVPTDSGTRVRTDGEAREDCGTHHLPNLGEAKIFVFDFLEQIKRRRAMEREYYRRLEADRERQRRI